MGYPETHDGVLHVTVTDAMRKKDVDKDGMLTKQEFWDVDTGTDEPYVLSEEDHADFAKLDKNGDGKLDVEEMKAWESGSFHTEEAMKKLFELADQNSDMLVSIEEFDHARELIAGSDAQYHLMEWQEHSEL